MAQGANQAAVALLVLAGCAGQPAAPGMTIPTTLLAMQQRGFRAGVALYPRCSIAPQSCAPPAPLVISPAAMCA